MRKPRWAYLLMLLVGAGLGVAIAGVPSRSEDPPLRVETESTTTTARRETTTTALREITTTTAPVIQTPRPPSPPNRPTPTTRRR